MKKSEMWMLASVVLLVLLNVESLLDHDGAHYGLGFYAWFGALSCLLVIAAALLFGRLFKRRDNYYDERKR